MRHQDTLTVFAPVLNEVRHDSGRAEADWGLYWRKFRLNKRERALATHDSPLVRAGYTISLAIRMHQQISSVRAEAED